MQRGRLRLVGGRDRALSPSEQRGERPGREEGLLFFEMISRHEYSQLLDYIKGQKAETPSFLYNIALTVRPRMFLKF